MNKERELLKRIVKANIIDYITIIEEAEEILAQPEQGPIDLDQVDNHLKICDLSEDYRDGYCDGVVFAEREHRIGDK